MARRNRFGRRAPVRGSLSSLGRALGSKSLPTGIVHAFAGALGAMIVSNLSHQRVHIGDVAGGQFQLGPGEMLQLQDPARHLSAAELLASMRADEPDAPDVDLNLDLADDELDMTRGASDPPVAAPAQGPRYADAAAFLDA